MLNTTQTIFPEAIFFLTDIIAMISIFAVLTTIVCKKYGKEELFLSLGTFLVYIHPHILYRVLINKFTIGQWTAACISIAVWIGSIYIQGNSLKEECNT